MGMRGACYASDGRNSRRGFHIFSILKTRLQKTNDRRFIDRRAGGAIPAENAQLPLTQFTIGGFADLWMKRPIFRIMRSTLETPRDFQEFPSAVSCSTVFTMQFVNHRKRIK